MDELEFHVDADIRRAQTLPGSFYVDPRVFAALRERVFAPSWQCIGDAARLDAPGTLQPRTLLEGMLDEPLLLARGAGGELRLLSNVCTHRGNLLATELCRLTTITCSYHGRRFDLDGRMLSMPEFEGVHDFPSARDHLPRLPLEALGPLHFTSLKPRVAFEAWIAPVRARMGWLPLERFVPDPTRTKDYTFDANWALYVDNFLEGFHIPFLHATLNRAIDFGSYTTELFAHASVQVALAREGELAFEPPAGSPDHGKRVAAYYWWLFPNLMLNFYPWGLSVNVVRPLAPQRTCVSFASYVWRPELVERGAGTNLEQVELEDEAVVEAVQRGVRSRLYDRGRYSPTREQGVHHFHRMLAAHFG
jgi:choline monooxygenase